MRRSLTLLAAALALNAPSARTQLAPTAFVDDTLSVPPALLARLGEVLPESPQPYAPFLSPALGGAVVFDEPGQLRLGFLGAGTTHRNTLGYFTYTLSPPAILDRQLVFPDVDPGQLQVGDVVTLRDADGQPRTFAAGTRVGFFLVADGALISPEIAQWSAASAQLPSLDPGVNGAIGNGLFSDLEALNAETLTAASDMARHAAWLRFPAEPGFLDGEPPLVLALEELHRGVASDHDFNDLTVWVEPEPRTALADTLSPFGVLPDDTDPDGDGVAGVADAYPNDPHRASVDVWPPDRPVLYGLEDLYPEIGDGDYNDAVAALRVHLVRSASGAVKDQLVTVHLLARGGSRFHRLGLHFPELEGATGTWQAERFLSDAEETHEVDAPRSVETLLAEGQRRVESLLPNSHLAIQAAPGFVFVNTQSSTAERPAASARLAMTFDEPVPAEQLLPRRLDVYWMVYDGADWLDVHAPARPSFDDVHGDLPPQAGPQAFVDPAGFPWMLSLYGDVRLPTETQPLAEAYPAFVDWAASHGAQSKNWANLPDADAELMAGLEALIPPREWTLTLPVP